MKPEFCNHPKCHANMVVNDRWSLRQVLNDVINLKFFTVSAFYVYTVFEFEYIGTESLAIQNTANQSF